MASHPELLGIYDRLTSQYLRLAHKCACQIQLSEADHDDLVQEAFLALYKAVRAYIKQGKTISNEPAFVATVFRRAMYTAAGYGLPDFVDIETAGVTMSGHAEYFEQVFNTEYLAELERMVGGLAKTIAAELIAPGPAAIKVAWSELRVQQQLFCLKDGQTISNTDEQAAAGLLVWKSARKRRSGLPQFKDKVVVTASHVRQALGISAEVWANEMARIAEFTTGWLALHAYRC